MADDLHNHLAASWCWLQKIDPRKQYNLFHIDRHNDLLESQIDWWIEELQARHFNFEKISITDLLAIKYSHPAMMTDKYPLFRWDNYITIFRRLYPNLISAACFATHKDGDKIEDFDISEHEIYQLPQNLSYWINEGDDASWIVNIDIDYFFADIDDKYFQLLTDDYVKMIAAEIKNCWNKIEVLTIALSPELCGGWDNAIRVAKIITDVLGVAWTLPK